MDCSKWSNPVPRRSTSPRSCLPYWCLQLTTPMSTNGGHTSPVIQVGHTHSQSIEPSPSDTVPVYGGVNYNIEHFIYYNNEIRYYE